jgi:mannose-6-phosphate isomerase-like protein (cupin superfamily)
MKHFFLIELGNEQRHGYIIGAKLSESTTAYSPWLEVGFNHQNFSWSDESPHLHTRSEEYLIVLQGRLDLLVNGHPVSVEPYQLVGFRTNVPHQIIGGEVPIMNFLIRVPGKGEDKINLNGCDSRPEIKNGLVKIDLRQPHDDYLLGACLPATHPNYSPFLDFTCVWGVDPAEEWRKDKLHFHNQREEYYFVLKGSLNLALDDSIISVNAGQIFGVRAGAVHRVIGGKGPVDVLFLRVPGGRGDKQVVETRSGSAD